MSCSKHLKIASELEMQEILDNKYSKSTEKQTKYDIDVNNMDPKNIDDMKNLDKCLTQFYASLDNLKKSTFDGVRYGLKRQFVEKFGPEIGIVHGHQFLGSSEMYKGVLKKLKVEGLGYTEHYAAIESLDISAILENLDTSTPAELQYLVWFDIQLYFCRRANENAVSMKATDFVIEETADKRRYLRKLSDELQKNRGRKYLYHYG